MPKRIFSIFFVCFLIITSVFMPISTSAYEVNSFEITAEAGMLVSLDTGEVLWEKNADQKMYPASITKIMTAILMVESEIWNPTAKVTLTKAALDKTLGTGLAVSLLNEGEEFTQLDLKSYAISIGLAFLVIPIVEIIKVVQRAAAKK